MTTNLHDKMLAAIDAYFSASNEIEAHIAEEQLLDVRDEINKHKLAADSLNEGLRLDEWDKIGCVNHDCDQCKALAQQEPVAKVYRHGKASNGTPWHGVHWFDEGVNMPDGTLLYTTPPAQPQQEPAAWMHTNAIGHVYFRKNPQDKTLNPVPLYTSPPASKPWVGLTKDEVWDLWNAHTEPPFPEFFVDFKRSYEVIEAKLKEKNT